jgi:hypothetical protein
VTKEKSFITLTPDGVADDEDDDDEKEHHRHGVVATLVRRNRVVTLRRASDRLEDESVENDENQHRNENLGPTL